MKLKKNNKFIKNLPDEKRESLRKFYDLIDKVKQIKEAEQKKVGQKLKPSMPTFGVLSLMLKDIRTMKTTEKRTYTEMKTQIKDFLSEEKE